MSQEEAVAAVEEAEPIGAGERAIEQNNVFLQSSEKAQPVGNARFSSGIGGSRRAMHRLKASKSL